MLDPSAERVESPPESWDEIPEDADEVEARYVADRPPHHGD